MRALSLRTTCHRLLAISTASGLIVSVALTACSDDAAYEGEIQESVDALRADESTLWSSTSVPKITSGPDSDAVELGVRFRADRDGVVNGVRFFKGAENRGVHVAHLWSETGALLATQTFRGEKPFGWQTVRFDSPVPVEAGRTYVASYHTDRGHFATDDDYFQGKGVDRGLLHAPADTASQHNGVYHYGAPGFPTESYRARNYWVDVIFKASTAEDAGQPLPGDGSTHSDAGSTDAGAPSSAFPTVATTGVPAGITLKTVPGQVTSGAGWRWDSRGWVQITEDNATLDGLDINGPVFNSSSGLTVKNTRIRCTGEDSFCITFKGSGSAIDSEIGGGADGITTVAPAVLTGGSDANILLQRLHIHHVVHGPHIDGGTTLVDSLIHELPMGDRGAPDAHTDGVFISTGHNIVIRHNTFSSGNSAEIFAQNYDNDAQGTGNLLIEQNYFIGEVRNGQRSSYAVAIENKDIKGPITVRNNTFTYGWQAGPMLLPSGAVATGNSFIDGLVATPEYQAKIY